MSSVTEAIRVSAELNALGARNGARLVAFNALIMTQPKPTRWTPDGWIPLKAANDPEHPSIIA